MPTENLIRYILALGANLGDRELTLQRAVDEIGSKIGHVVACSRFIETAPLVLAGEDPAAHPAYLNGVVLVKSTSVPEQVLDQLLAIEKDLGRVRGVTDKRWQPRMIDLDLIVADDHVIATPRLTVPHPEMHRRSFVLGPMCEVWPEWVHPLLKRSARVLLRELAEG